MRSFRIPYLHRFIRQAGQQPSQEQIGQSEIAINLADLKVFTKDLQGQIVTLSDELTTQQQLGELQMKVEHLLESLQGLTDNFVSLEDTVNGNLPENLTFVTAIPYADIVQPIPGGGSPFPYAMKEITHNLNSNNPIVEIWDGTGRNIITPIYLMDSNKMRINCNAMQAGEQWTVRISK
jgi:hypothetical protein